MTAKAIPEATDSNVTEGQVLTEEYSGVFNKNI